MEYEFRIMIEKVSVASQEVVKRDTMKIYDIRPPKSILSLGLRHEEQISLLTKVKNGLLAEQSALIDCGMILAQIVVKSSRRMDSCSLIFMRSSATINYASKSIVAIIRSVIGRVPRPQQQFLALTFIPT